MYLILELYSQKIRFNDFPGIFVKYLCIFRNLLMKQRIIPQFFFFAFLITLRKVYRRSHLLSILECSMMCTNVS